MKPALIIVGIGNPGNQYARTRHNIGWQALDVLAATWGTGEWQEQPKFLCQSVEARFLTFPVLLVKPTTYVNRSGECVRKLLDFYKLDPAQQLLVLVDDIDLPLATLRLRANGGPGTHNGLRSLQEHFGEGYARLRIGLGTPVKTMDLAAWVLSIPSPEEQKAFTEVLAGIPDVVKKFLLEQKPKEANT
jgi:peptidyl-tRNA hydrolase, PTH1 family